ncbi:MAG: exodeoxyribonuclease VII small subunit [Desulfuromonadales bacterium]|nr:exodeoxyribonuclease VII small subunit [Desulfuromonadales bacterium]
MPKEITFEQALKSLEDAVARLEKGQIPLDEALDCFEAGVKSANVCRKKLQAVEARIETLIKSSDGSFATEPFGDNENLD